jgi:hypothetical protein
MMVVFELEDCWGYPIACPLACLKKIGGKGELKKDAL